MKLHCGNHFIYEISKPTWNQQALLTHVSNDRHFSPAMSHSMLNLYIKIRINIWHQGCWSQLHWNLTRNYIWVHAWHFLHLHQLESSDKTKNTYSVTYNCFPFVSGLLRLELGPSNDEGGQWLQLFPYEVRIVEQVHGICPHICLKESVRMTSQHGQIWHFLFCHYISMYIIYVIRSVDCHASPNVDKFTDGNLSRNITVFTLNHNIPTTGYGVDERIPVITVDMPFLRNS